MVFVDIRFPQRHDAVAQHIAGIAVDDTERQVALEVLG